MQGAREYPTYEDFAVDHAHRSPESTTRWIRELGEHPACSLPYHQLIRSTKIVNPGGTPAEVNIYLVGTNPVSYVLVYGNRWALSGYFGSEAEAVEAWEQHAALLRSQAVAS